jgi:hypothetical protein
MLITRFYNVIFLSSILFLGFILGIALFLKLSSNYEELLFDRIISKTFESHRALGDEQKVLGLLDSTYKLLEPRKSFFGGKEWLSIRDRLLRSSDVQMLDGGACGTHSHVLAKLLKQSNIPVRIAQMKCGQQYGCHIVVEAKISNKFVVLDPLYNLSFRSPDGQLASFSEISSDWDFYKEQVPEEYVMDMKYEGVRYTNWDKIPVLMPLIKRLLVTFYGDDAENISIRSYVLNLYLTYFYLLMAVVPFVLAFSVFTYKRTSFRI